MNLPTRIALTALAAFAVLSPAAEAKRSHQNLPTAIQVPAGHKLFESHHAIGVQIYGCNGTAWSLVLAALAVAVVAAASITAFDPAYADWRRIAQGFAAAGAVVTAALAAWHVTRRGPWLR